MVWLHPTYLWTLIGVPLAIGLLLWAAWQRRKGLRAFGDLSVVSKLAESISARRRRWKGALFVVGVTLIALALAGPRLGTKLREVKREGVDLVVALDVSLSMKAEDVSPSRLDRARNEIKKMLDELQGDRVGLVLFAGDAFVQCPLTTDYNAVRLFLDIADPSMIPTPGTNFGAAIRMAVRAFESSENKENAERPTRALLIVSDGENHEGNLDALVKEARDAGITLYSAGVGETEGAPIPLYQYGRLAGYKKDDNGRVVNTRLEEDALQELSRGGAYFRIAGTSSSLTKLTSALDRLEKTEFSADVFEEYEEQYQWPLLLGLVFLLAEVVISDRRKTTDRKPA